MLIDLTQLDTDGVRFDEAFGSDDLAGRTGREERFLPIRADLSVFLRPERGGARATGEVAATVRAECDRCLKPLEIDVSGRFDQRYVWGAVDRAPEEHEVDVEDLDVERLEEPTLDTATLAREQVELAEPIRVVCSEDCLGLCPTCGADRNTNECGCEQKPADPRWDALKELKNQ